MTNQNVVKNDEQSIETLVSATVEETLKEIRGISKKETHKKESPKEEPISFIFERVTQKAMACYKVVSDLEMRTNKASYKLADAIYDVCLAYLDTNDTAFKEEMDKHIKSRGLKLAVVGANPLLNVVRSLFAELRNVVDDDGKVVVNAKTGEPKKKWHFNRSVEKYAYVCGVADYLEFKSGELVKLLEKGGKTMVGDTKVDATIVGLAGAYKYVPKGVCGKPSPNRGGKDEEDKKEFKSLTPLATIPLQKNHKAKFGQSRFYLVVARVEDGVMHILGDSGKDENEVVKLIKANHDDFKLNATGTTYAYQIKEA